MNKILIVDDEPVIIDLLETCLKKEGNFIIYKAYTGMEAVESAKNENPDMVILDVMLPDFDGYEVCRKIREFSRCPILFLSARDEESDKVLGLGIGGDDYVTKPFQLKEVAFRVKAHLRRANFANNTQPESEIFNFGNIEVDATAMSVKKNGNELPLTAKEFQMILYFCKRPNMIISKTKLYEGIWGEDFLGDDNTIMVHIRHLREKIEDDPGQPRYIQTIKGLGYKLVYPVSGKAERNVLN